MALLEQEKFDKVIAYGKQAFRELEKENYEMFLELGEKGWEQFPSPVENWNQAYNYAKSFFNNSLSHGDLEEAKKWINRLIENNNNLHLSDEETMHLMGKYCFEKGDYDDARKHWDMVVKAAGHRYFQDDKREYLDFYNNSQKDEEDETLPDSLFQTICQRLDKGDEAVAEERYEDAIAAYQSAIDILPEPKSDWDIFTTLVTSLGDTYYETRQYTIADSYYATALRDGNGIENPYVWYANGRNLIRMGETKAAQDSLMRAYMLDGDEIFTTDDDEFKVYINDFISKKEE